MLAVLGYLVTSRLWADFDRGAHRHEIPDLVDLRIGDGDAAEGPVDGAVRRADKAAAVGQAVNHDVAARADAQLGCTLAVGGVGIRDVQSLVVGRVRVAAVDDVAAFGSAAVALTLLWGEAAGA